MTVIPLVGTRFKYDIQKIQTNMNPNSNNICQLLTKINPMKITEAMTIIAQDINT